MTELTVQGLLGHFQSLCFCLSLQSQRTGWKGEGSKDRRTKLGGTLGARKGGKSDPFIKRSVLLYLHCILLMSGGGKDRREAETMPSSLLYEFLLLPLNPVLIGAPGCKLIILVSPKREAVP